MQNTLKLKTFFHFSKQSNRYDCHTPCHTHPCRLPPSRVVPHALTFIKNSNCHLLHCLNSCTWPQNNTQSNIHKPHFPPPHSKHPNHNSNIEHTHTKEKSNNPKFAKLANDVGEGVFSTPRQPFAVCHLPIFRCASENLWYALPTIFQTTQKRATTATAATATTTRDNCSVF